MGQVPSVRFRDSWLIRSSVTMARISALPLLVVSLTGWIPSKDLELGPKGPWPWGALIGLSFILVGLLGLLLPRGKQFRNRHPLHSSELADQSSTLTKRRAITLTEIFCASTESPPRPRS